MLKTLFNQYKWYALALLFLAYSVGVWNVSSKVHDTEVARDRLRAVEQIIEIKQKNEETLDAIRKDFQSSMKKQAEQSTKHYKELSDAIAKDKRYTDCTVTDGVRDIYERKLESQ
jgi:hypothetical protein